MWKQAISIFSVVLLSAGLASTAHADNQGYYPGKTFKSAKVKHHRYDDHYDRRYRHERSKKRKHHRHHDTLRLDIPVHVEGKRYIKLKRLIGRYYNINLDHYNLKKVVLKNHNHYGRANLRVGHYQTSPLALHAGRNHISAPARDSYGKWTLALRGVYTDNLRVVLEPKYSQARYRGHKRDRRHHGYDRGWYAYH